MDLISDCKLGDFSLDVLCVNFLFEYDLLLNVVDKLFKCFCMYKFFIG